MTKSRKLAKKSDKLGGKYDKRSQTNQRKWQISVKKATN